MTGYFYEVFYIKNCDSYDEEKDSGIVFANSYKEATQTICNYYVRISALTIEESAYDHGLIPMEEDTINAIKENQVW